MFTVDIKTEPIPWTAAVWHPVYQVVKTPKPKGWYLCNRSYMLPKQQKMFAEPCFWPGKNWKRFKKMSNET